MKYLNERDYSQVRGGLGNGVRPPYQPPFVRPDPFEPEIPTPVLPPDSDWLKRLKQRRPQAPFTVRQGGQGGQGGFSDAALSRLHQGADPELP